MEANINYFKTTDFSGPAFSSKENKDLIPLTLTGVKIYSKVLSIINCFLEDYKPKNAQQQQEMKNFTEIMEFFFEDTLAAKKNIILEKSFTRTLGLRYSRYHNLRQEFFTAFQEIKSKHHLNKENQPYGRYK